MMKQRRRWRGEDGGRSGGKHKRLGVIGTLSFGVIVLFRDDRRSLRSVSE